jgi:hypothetical protein
MIFSTTFMGRARGRRRSTGLDLAGEELGCRREQAARSATAGRTAAARREGGEVDVFAGLRRSSTPRSVVNGIPP